MLQKLVVHTRLYDPDKNIVFAEPDIPWLLDSVEKIDKIKTITAKEYKKLGKKFYVVVNVDNSGIVPKMEIVKYYAETIRHTLENFVLSYGYYGTVRNFYTNTVIYQALQLGYSPTIYPTKEAAVAEIMRQQNESTPTQRIVIPPELRGE
jgi:hypothetical protein